MELFSQNMSAEGVREHALRLENFLILTLEKCHCLAFLVTLIDIFHTQTWNFLILKIFSINFNFVKNLTVFC